MQPPNSTTVTKLTPTPDIPVGPLDDSLKFFLANMAFEFTAQDVKNWFQRFGPVNHCKIIYDKTGKSKGYGFLYMLTSESFQVVQEFCLRTNHKITMLGRPQVHCQKNDENRIKNHSSNNNPNMGVGILRRSYDVMNKSTKLNSFRKYISYNNPNKCSQNYMRVNPVMYSHHPHANRSNMIPTATTSALTTPYSHQSTVIASFPPQSYRDRSTTVATVGNVGNVMTYANPTSSTVGVSMSPKNITSPKAYTSSTIPQGTTYASAASFNYNTQFYSQAHTHTPTPQTSSLHSPSYAYGIPQDISQGPTSLHQSVSQATNSLSQGTAVVSSTNPVPASSIMTNSVLLSQSNPTNSIPITTATSGAEVQVSTNPSLSHVTTQPSIAYQPVETHSLRSYDTSMVTSHSTLSPYDPVLQSNPSLNNGTKHSTYTINPRAIIAPPSYYETQSTTPTTNREVPLQSQTHLQPRTSMTYPSTHQPSHFNTSLSQTSLQPQTIPPPPPPRHTPHNRAKLLLTHLPKNCEPSDIVTFFSKTFSYNIRRCTLQYDSTTSYNLGHVEFTTAEEGNAVLNLAQAGHVNYRGRSLGATLDWNPPPDGVQVPIGLGAPVTSSTGSFTNTSHSRMGISKGGNFRYCPY